MDFGFLFCRVVRFYQMSYEDVLNLPLRTFWLMSNTINRLAAEEDMRKLDVGASVQSAEGYQKARDALKQTMGSLTLSPPEPLLAGLHRLKQRIREEESRRKV